MGVPAGIGIVDTMIGFPSVDRRDWYASMSDVLRDEGSKTFQHPAGYMFKDTPTITREPDSIDQLLFEMDRFGIERTRARDAHRRAARAGDHRAP